MKDNPHERSRRDGQPTRRDPDSNGLMPMVLTGSAITFAAYGANGGFGSSSPDLASVSLAGTVGWSAQAVALIVACLILNGLYVLAQTAIECVKQVHIRFAREKDDSLAQRLERVVEVRPRLVAGCSFGSQVCRFGLVIGAFALAPSVLNVFKPGEVSLGDLFLMGIGLSIPIGLINLLAAELIPKNYGALKAPEFAARLYRFASWSSKLFAPAIWLVTSVASFFTARVGAKATFAVTNQAEEEIKGIVEIAEQSGELEEEERELLHSVFEFADTVAREVMTPRIDLDAMPVDSDPADVVKLIEESGHSRIPLYENNDDQIIGVVHAKDLLLATLHRNGEVNLRDLLREPIFVPENKDLHELLAEMRLRRSHMAVVQDEFGGTAGIVTLEDIVEELVGDIVDEYDIEEEEIVRQEDGALVVEGRTHIDDVNDELGATFSSEEFDTVGGFVFGSFGYQPKQGESLVVDGYRFIVEETDGRRIIKLRVSKEPVTEDVLEAS